MDHSEIAGSTNDSFSTSPLLESDMQAFTFELVPQVESHMFLKSQMIQISAWFSELPPVKQIAFIQILLRNLHKPYLELVASNVNRRLEKFHADETVNELAERANSLEFLNSLLYESRVSGLISRLFDLLPYFTRKNKTDVQISSTIDLYMSLIDRLIWLISTNESEPKDHKFVPKHSGQFSQLSSVISSTNISPNSSFSFNSPAQSANCTETQFGQLILLMLSHSEFTPIEKANLVDRLNNHHLRIQDMFKSTAQQQLLTQNLIFFERLLDCTLAMAYDLVDYFPFERNSEFCEKQRHNPKHAYAHSGSTDLSAQSHYHNNRYGQYLHPGVASHRNSFNNSKQTMDFMSSLNSSGFLSGSECFLADSSMSGSRLSLQPSTRGSMNADLVMSDQFICSPETNAEHFLKCGMRQSGLMQPRRQSASTFSLKPNCPNQQIVMTSNVSTIAQPQLPPKIQIEFSPSSPQLPRSQTSTPDKFGGSHRNLFYHEETDGMGDFGACVINHSISMSADMQATSTSRAGSSFGDNSSACSCDCLDMHSTAISPTCSNCHSPNRSPSSAFYLNAAAINSACLKCLAPPQSLAEHRRSYTEGLTVKEMDFPSLDVNHPCGISISTPANLGNFNPGMKYLMVWLKFLRLHKYGTLLQHLTYEELLDLSESWLHQKNVTQGARNKILVNLEKLKRRPASLQKHIQFLEQQTTTTVKTGCMIDLLKDVHSMLLSPFPADSSELCAQFCDCINKAWTLCLGMDAQLDSEVHSRLYNLLSLVLEHDAFTGQQKDAVSNWLTSLKSAYGTVSPGLNCPAHSPARIGHFRSTCRESRRQSTGSTGTSPVHFDRCMDHQMDLRMNELYFAKTTKDDLELLQQQQPSILHGAHMNGLMAADSSNFVLPVISHLQRKSVERTNSAPNDSLLDNMLQQQQHQQQGVRMPTVRAARYSTPRLATPQQMPWTPQQHALRFRSPGAAPAVFYQQFEDKQRSMRSMSEAPVTASSTTLVTTIKPSASDQINFDLDQLTREVTDLAIEDSDSAGD